MLVEDYRPTRKTIKYIDPVLIKKAAKIHSALGAIILILSGAVLYSLPAKAFYLAFITGSYFFFSGILIVFSIVNERTARKLAKYLVAYWVIKLRQ